MSIIVELVSVPDRDDLVAEIWFNGQMIAEVRGEDGGGYVVEIYPPPGRQSWCIHADDLISSLRTAEERLRNSPETGVAQPK